MRPHGEEQERKDDEQQEVEIALLMRLIQGEKATFEGLEESRLWTHSPQKQSPQKQASTPSPVPNLDNPREEETEAASGGDVAAKKRTLEKIFWNNFPKLMGLGQMASMTTAEKRVAASGDVFANAEWKAVSSTNPPPSPNYSPHNSSPPPSFALKSQDAELLVMPSESHNETGPSDYWPDRYIDRATPQETITPATVSHADDKSPRMCGIGVLFHEDTSIGVKRVFVERTAPTDELMLSKSVMEDDKRRMESTIAVHEEDFHNSTGMQRMWAEMEELAEEPLPIAHRAQEEEKTPPTCADTHSSIRTAGDCDKEIETKAVGDGDKFAVAVNFSLRLRLNFAAAGTPHSPGRLFFEHNVISDLAAAAQVPPRQFRILRISPDSILVDLQVSSGHRLTGEQEPREVVAVLAHQVTLPSSPLLRGNVTRYADSISCPDEYVCDRVYDNDNTSAQHIPLQDQMCASHRMTCASSSMRRLPFCETSSLAEDAPDDGIIEALTRVKLKRMYENFYLKGSCSERGKFVTPSSQSPSPNAMDELYERARYVGHETPKELGNASFEVDTVCDGERRARREEGVGMHLINSWTSWWHKRVNLYARAAKTLTLHEPEKPSLLSSPSANDDVQGMQAGWHVGLEEADTCTRGSIVEALTTVQHFEASTGKPVVVSAYFVLSPGQTYA
jgi:hypothetical protein